MTAQSRNRPSVATARELAGRAMQSEQSHDPAARAPARLKQRRSRRVPIAAAMGLVVVAGSTVAIWSAQPAAQHPAPAPSATAPVPDVLRSALLRRLPAGVQDEPALTWTEAASSPTGGPVDTAGKTPVIVAACAGGGSIEVRLSNRPRIRVGCSRLSAIGPVALTAGGKVSTPSGGVGMTVSATSGHPRYILKVLALDPESAAPPRAWQPGSPSRVDSRRSTV